MHPLFLYESETTIIYYLTDRQRGESRIAFSKGTKE